MGAALGSTHIQGSLCVQLWSVRWAERMSEGLQGSATAAWHVVQAVEFNLLHASLCQLHSGTCVHAAVGAALGTTALRDMCARSYGGCAGHGAVRGAAGERDRSVGCPALSTSTRSCAAAAHAAREPVQALQVGTLAASKQHARQAAVLLCSSGASFPPSSSRPERARLLTQES